MCRYDYNNKYIILAAKDTANWGIFLDTGENSHCEVNKQLLQ